MAFYVVEVDNDGFKVLDSAGNVIDPAKDSSVQSLLTTLNAIKDTAGIKKIVDALPAGTNVIGKVDQGSAGLSLWKVDGSGVTQPISAVALPLPAGASTEATLLLIKAKTDNLDIALSTRATEVTLAAADGRLTTIDAVLDSIKDADGIKKITDQLPAGTNEIGKVAQGTRAAAAGGWPQYLVDSTGNVTGVILDSDGPVYRLQTQAQLQTHSKGATPAGLVTSEAISADIQALHVSLKKHTTGVPDGDVRIVDGSDNPITIINVGAQYRFSTDGRVVDADGHIVGLVLDGALYRLQADAKIAKGSSALVHLDALDTAAGKGRLKATLYSPEGEAIAFGSVPPNAASIRNAFVLSGGSDDLRVDGNGTPVVFSYAADAGQDISLQEIKFVMASNSITFGSNAFGATAGPLTNGLLVEIISGGTPGTIYNLKQNESFVNFASPGGFEWVISSKDMMSATYLIGGGLKLVHGTGDMVRVTVRDNITACGVYFKCFVKGNLLTAV